MIVTEIPQARFAKPKVKDSNSHFSAENLLKPSFPNRRNGKMHRNTHCLGKIGTNLHIDMVFDEIC